jgi:two-component system, OmpR family, response regulator ChvI
VHNLQLDILNNDFSNDDDTNSIKEGKIHNTTEEGSNSSFNSQSNYNTTTTTTTTDNNHKQITFFNYTHGYCVGIIDIVDSTKITQELASSNKIRNYYSIFLNTMASIIKDHNGKVIKNAGDCLIYYFPKTVDSDVNESAFQDVLDCGLAMIDANSTLNEELSKNGLPPINYRISANYGKVELATSSNSNSVDLFGPTVNICSKINHLALSNEMVIYNDLYTVINKTPFFYDYCFKNVSQQTDDKYSTFTSYPVYSVHRLDSPRQQKEIDNKKRQSHMVYKQNKLNQVNSSFNILLIDDDKDILFTFTTIIAGDNYKTTSFSDPNKALENFSQVSPYHYDLIIMDIRMPGLNGIQLYSKIKVMNPDIKVLFLSALDAVEELLSIFPDIKNSEIIRKPIEPQALLLKINTILKT